MEEEGPSIDGPMALTPIYFVELCPIRRVIFLKCVCILQNRTFKRANMGLER